MVSKEKKIAGLLQQGLQYHRAGNLQQAERIYKQILVRDSTNVEANHLLGVIACQAEQYGAGIRLIRKALQKKPDHAAAHKNLGKAFMGLGKLDEAEASLKKSISLNPDYAEAYNDLGIVRYELGQLDVAIAGFDKAIACRPGYGEAYYNLGNVYYDQGKLDSAAIAFQKAIALKPDYAEAHNNLGNTLRLQDNPVAAGPCFQKALALRPDYAEAYNNLGNLLNDQGRLAEAVTCCRRALAINPDFAEAHSNLGNALSQQGQLEEAIASFKNALALKPAYDKAHSDLARAFSDQGHLDKAVSGFRKLIDLGFSANSNLLFTLNYVPGITQQEIYEESIAWGDQQISEYQNGPREFANTRVKQRRLRIGYLSPDFRGHSVTYFIEPVLKAHNREAVEVFCYANVKKVDRVTGRLQSEADHWSSIVGRSDVEVVEQIRKDAIDILVDLAGHTGDNRLLLFARQPAPLQVTWLGYPNTTGLRTIDYRLTDAVADPVGEADSLHSEKLIRLAYGFLCYQAETAAPGVAALPCQEHGHITFGSFNNLKKTTPEVIKLWSKILHAVPESRLLLKTRQLTDEETRTRYFAMFEKEGISPDRLKLHGRMPKQKDHLGLYNRVDIGLDPFPYNGTTTTCEALWMGVPVVTMLGDRHAGRVGASIMHQVGLEELVADSIDGYVQLARALAFDRERLQMLRGTLREQMRGSPLMDGKLFTETLEDAYRQLWTRWCDNSAE